MINMSRIIKPKNERNESHVQLPPTQKLKDSTAPIFKAKKSKIVIYKLEKSPVQKRNNETLKKREILIPVNEYKEEPKSPV